ncbi:T9SS type A sorting domain-containing protein, partial [Winogradskyella sp. PE311]|uniref:T9SS type A sorting domain-containing protein n=1 Tax=Winogradskyella sp. PE311 TaxID=3366943 RepID=UPI003980F145
EGVVDGIDVEFDASVPRFGTNASWVITDQATGNILGLPAMVPAGGFVLEGAGPGVCDIWYLRYEDGLTGLAAGNNVADLMGCFDLSNPISVTRNAVDGGAIQIAGTTDTTAEICVGEGVVDGIDVEFDASVPRFGTNASWVITDQATGNILGLPAMVPAGGFVLEGAGPGVCDIWYLRYEDGLTGLAAGNNVADLMGCFDLSNPISVTRNAVNGGAIQIAGTNDTTATICAGEGVDDLIEVEFVDMSVLSGDSSIWVITDQATGDILGTPPSGPFNLEGAGAGVCDIWHLRYTGDIGLATAANVADLTGCFDLSNPISVTRLTGTDCNMICDAQGGEIQIAGTTDTTTEICVGEGVDDLIEVEFVDMSVLSGDSSIWVITDQATGDILGTPMAGPFNLEGAPTGVCDIWYLRYTGDIGLATASNVSDLTGCFDLSNPISVTRNAVDGGAIQIAGTTDTTAEICVGEGVDDLIEVEFVDMSVLSGDSSIWVITDQATGDILGTPMAGPFNLEGAPTGVCDIWYLRYTGDIGLATASNVSDLTGCFDLSNPISVTRNSVNGGEIQIAGTTDTTATICAGEGVDDLIEVEFVDETVRSGDSFAWVITDNATGNILGTPPSGPFNLEGAGAGVCDIWYLRYTGDIGLATAANVADLTGCFDLSNPISVTRLTGTDCDVLSINDISSNFDFSVYPNPAKDSVNINFNGNSVLDLNVQLFDVLGKEVYSRPLSTQGTMTIDISNLENGTYFMNIIDITSGNRIVKRIIKN